MKRTILFLAFLIPFGMSGCKDYFDLNENPGLISDPPLRSLLSTTTQKTGLNGQRVGNITSYFVQYLANPGAGGSTDTYQETDYSGTWDAIYYTMADLTDMKRLAGEQASSEYVGVANVLLSYNLNLIADTFGSAPFSKAFTSTTLTPAYDSQEEIYSAALRLLDEGITELAKTDSKIKLSAADDLIHKGKREAWIKTAHALRARMLNKVSRRAGYDPAAVLAAVSKSYTSNAADAEMSTFLLSSPIVSVGAANLTLADVFKEKYVITYLNPEAWNDARRFDYKYKDFKLPESAALPTFIRRVAYPNGELAENGINVPVVESLSEKLYWDK